MVQAMADAPAVESIFDEIEVEDSALLGLVMIVKNESHGIADTLRSLRPHIDCWLVFDTGSTDGTQEIVHRELAGIPGTLVEGDFIDFSTARNRALDAFERIFDRVPFAIMPDADDYLVGGDELRMWLADPNRRHADIQQAYMLNLRRGHDDYYLPLVMRTSSKCRYRGRVHECSNATGVIEIPRGVWLGHNARPQSHEASMARWVRDRELLQQDVVADPDNARAWFYLAQTYECLGMHDGAIEFYKKRITLGGFADEVFEARRRIGKILKFLDRPWPEIVAVNLEAHLFDPRRAEPLYEIAEIFHKGDHHALTWIFASRAADLPMPRTSMFVDKEIYDYKAADLAAISGFYLGNQLDSMIVRESGRCFAEKAVQARPSDERLRANLAFYARSAHQMFDAHGVTIVPIQTLGMIEPPFHPGNPSIANTSKGLRCILRTTNYKIDNGRYLAPRPDGTYAEVGDTVIYTKNLMLELSAVVQGGRLADIKTERICAMADLPLKAGAARTDFPVRGYEDCRLFEVDGALCATATACDFPDAPLGHGAREIALLRINEEANYAIMTAEPIRGPWSVRHQKNWMPFQSHPLNLQRSPELAYSITDRVQKIEIDVASGTGKLLDSAAGDIGRLRGGSQFVDLRMARGFHGGSIGIVHEVAWVGANRIYLHRFVKVDWNGSIEMTEPFYFKHRGIEFCAGLALVPSHDAGDHGAKLVASFSVNDSEAYFAIFDLGDVMQMCSRGFFV